MWEANTSLSDVLNEELGITMTLLIHYELSEFERRRRILVRSKDRVKSGNSVRCILTVVFVTAARCPFIAFGGLTDVDSAEQNSRQEHVQ